MRRSCILYTLLGAMCLGVSATSPGHTTFEEMMEYEKNRTRRSSEEVRAPGGEPWLNDLEVESRPHPTQGLGGRRVFLVPGHGRTYNEGAGWWGWQRDVVDGGELEDLITPRISNRWLAKYFENAGANVIVSRERDEQLNELHLDEADTANSEMTGSWTEVYTSNPYEGSALRTPADSGATFTWKASIPEKGAYGFRMWYPNTGDAAEDVTVIIHTAGGDVEATLNQFRNTERWYWIDSYVFDEGNVPIATIIANSSDSSRYVYADGIRLGGGMGDVDFGGGVSGLPRWQEYTKGWAFKYGAPSYVWDQQVNATDSFMRRDMGYWAGADIYLELHSNADGTGSGTQTGTMTYWSYSNDATQRSQFEAMHDNMLSTLRAEWMASWRDAGFLNDSVFSTSLPSNLIEMAFHDRTVPDLESLLDPDFRLLIARSIYEGAIPIVRGDTNGVALPEPPTAPYVKNLGGGEIMIGWSMPAFGPAPEDYKIYSSEDGLGFDLGTSVGNTMSTTLDGYQEGDEVYFQIRALNAGGRSFPTETIGVRVGDSDPLLLVNGFDRLDRYVQEVDNTRNFVIEHLQAFGAADPSLAIDYTSNDAVSDGDLNLNDYPLVDWYLGLERGSQGDETFNATEQSIVSSYMDSGGRLFVNGAYLGTDLDINGLPSDQEFAFKTLRFQGTGEQSEAPSASGIAGEDFDGLVLNVSKESGGPYELALPDEIIPGELGYRIMEWGDGYTAAVAYPNGPGKSIVSSVPLEAVTDSAQRIAYAEEVLEFLRAPVEEVDLPPVVQGLAIAPISQTEAYLSWTTNQPSTNIVEWSELAGDFEQSKELLDTDVVHSTVIQGLTSNTDYKMRIKPKNLFDLEGTSETFYFKTALPETIPPVIENLKIIAISDRDATVFFTTTEPALSDITSLDVPALQSEPLENGYRLSHLHYVDNLPSSSTFDVIVTATDIQNNSVTEMLEVTTGSSTSALIVDNLDSGFSVVQGSWSSGSFGNPYGGDYRFAFINTSEVSAEVSWEVTIPQSGLYRISTRYTSGGNRTNSAHYTVEHPDGNQNLFMNQQSNGDEWITLIDSLFFNQGTTSRVLLDNNADNGSVVIGDAVRWEYLGIGRARESDLDNNIWLFE